MHVPESLKEQLFSRMPLNNRDTYGKDCGNEQQK